MLDSSHRIGSCGPHTPAGNGFKLRVLPVSQPNTAFVFGNNSTATVGAGNNLTAGVIGNGQNATAPPSVIIAKP